MYIVDAYYPQTTKISYSLKPLRSLEKGRCVISPFQHTSQTQPFIDATCFEDLGQSILAPTVRTILTGENAGLRLIAGAGLAKFCIGFPSITLRADVGVGCQDAAYTVGITDDLVLPLFNTTRRGRL